ncbi:hypothetical protein JXJ21_01215 [candidate division KSB1 bacterium]|nr:hypothetical protein [candidate division KSB1 bacterium]
MDQFLYTRTSISGWLFFAFIFMSLWLSNAREFHEIISFVGKTDQKFVTALLGAVVGIGTPPTLGFLFERISSVLFTIFSLLQKRLLRTEHLLLGQMWYFRCNDNLLSYYLKQLDEDTEKPNIDAAAFFHIVFYAFADKTLIDWARRRRMHLYASFTSGLAILIALLILHLNWPPKFLFTISSVIIIAILFYHAVRESIYHEKVLDNWTETKGNK